MTLSRDHSVDALRGMAIVWMVIYHFFFDLNYFGYIHIQMDHELGWRIFRYTIMSSFLFCVGISLVLSYRQGIIISKLKRRMLILVSAALAVTAMSVFLFPSSFIYFGILHLIALATLAALPFINHPRVALSVGLSILLLYHFDYLKLHGLFNWLQPYLNLPAHTEDLARFFPWFAPVLIGVFAGHFGIHRNRFLARFGETRSCLWASRNALLIYMLHQPILFAGFLTLAQLRGV